MKKQFLFLLVLAFFAGITAYGQAVPGSAPRGTNCTDDALHPIAGKPYTYQASANPTGGNFLFWATKDQNFITTVAGTTTNNLATMLTTPVDLLATSGNYGASGATDNVSITWSDLVLSQTTAGSPTFVAAHYAAPVSGCADNFRVWSILPIKAFTVDIRNIENASSTILGYDAAEDQCMDVVRGATYSGGAMVYDFGTQVLYFEVVAANFTNSWTPTFTLSGLHAVQTGLVEWTYDAPATWGAGTVWNAANTVVTTNETNTSNGVSIYVRVTITNNNYEGTVARPITLAVDGVNSVNEWDIENNTLTNPGPLCNPGTLNDMMDVAVQSLQPRPTLTPVTPVPFVPGNEQN